MSPWRGCVGQSVPLALVGIALRQPRSQDPEPQRPRFPLGFEGKRNERSRWPMICGPGLPRGVRIPSLNFLSQETL